MSSQCTCIKPCLAVLTAMVLMFFCAAGARADSIESVLMPGKVIEGHAKYESECAKCHMRFNKAAQTGLCLDCHKDVASDVRQKQGYHGRLTEQECRACHTEHKGRAAHIAPLDEKSFNHTKTDFVLKGGHADAKIACRDCHRPGVKYRDTSAKCNACHKKDDKHKGNLGTACETCHNEKDWKDAKFDHEKTRFPLAGKHSDVKCEDCHQNQRFKGVPRDCLSCHRKDDKHKGSFGAKCESCHTERDWKEMTFNHDKTRYPLRGKHRTTKCESCHKSGLFKEKLKTTCVACHRADDVHKGGLGEKCESCHSEREWRTTSFNHDQDTKFPLRDKHKMAKCTACHTNANYRDKLKTACIACHLKEDEHKGKYGEKCETCHSEKDWKISIFQHDRDTKYPLRGKHIKVKCMACHKGHLYKDKAQSTCYACHQQDDKHKGQEGKKCESCHNEKDWKDTRFDHGLARFPLLGKHMKVECKKCHLTPAFKDASMECNTCHAKEDVHKKRLGTQCGQCHNARDWKLWDFDHDQRTKFKLDGGHKGLECVACHTRPAPGKLSLSGTCVSCHEREDVHDGSFGRQCERCHVTSSFKSIKGEMGFGTVINH